MAKKLISVEGIELPDGALEVTPEESIVPVYAIPLSAEEIAEQEAWAAGAYEREYAEVQRQREFAYRAESDVLRDYWLREENGVTKEDWLAKVAEIRERYPYPVKP